MTTTLDDSVPRIIDNYRKLCAYCDSIWNRVRETYPDEIACRKGCGICCELRSVNQIEAYVIRSYVVNNVDNGDDINNADTIIADTANADACPFLVDQSCAVYPARPLICRTHGLILRSSEFPLSRQSASCPYNFPSTHPDDFPPELTVDVDVITKNLANLNLAYCIASGIDVKNQAETRVPLRDLAAR